MWINCENVKSWAGKAEEKYGRKSVSIGRLGVMLNGASRDAET